MRYLLLLLPFVFSFCKNGTSDNQLVVTFSQTSLRDAPGEKSIEFRALKQGERLIDLQQVSDFESEIRFPNSRVQAPWLKVQTAQKEVGWVFAAWVEPVQPQEEWLLQKKMACYFGNALAERRNEYVRALATPGSELGFADRYREAVALRDTFVLLLARRAETNGTLRKPDFSWLPVALPGFIFQQVAGGTQPFLFADYRYWQQRAAASKGRQDDTFVEACLTAFPTDSIESFFPFWTFQLSDFDAASQLGTGRHLKMLQAIDESWLAGTLFRPELAAFKETLLDDILSQNTAYWQPEELILKELEKIFSTEFACLNGRDRMAMQARMTMFAESEAHGVRVNLRSGK